MPSGPRSALFTRRTLPLTYTFKPKQIGPSSGNKAQHAATRTVTERSQESRDLAPSTLFKMRTAKISARRAPGTAPLPVMSSSPEIPSMMCTMPILQAFSCVSYWSSICTVFADFPATVRTRFTVPLPAIEFGTSTSTWSSPAYCD